MRQAEGQLAIIAQSIKAHDPGLWPSINPALIAHDEKLVLGMERCDPGEAVSYFRRLERQEVQFQKRRLTGEPRSATPAQRALSIEQYVESLHPAATGICVCGGSGGGARWSRARFRIFENTSKLKKCMPPRTSSTTPTLRLSVSNTP
jgi:hypothetical protein